MKIASKQRHFLKDLLRCASFFIDSSNFQFAEQTEQYSI